MFLCPNCGRMRLVIRDKECEPTKAVWAKIECPDCDTGSFANPEYYGEDGFISNEDLGLSQKDK